MSHELREESSGDLTRRRWIVGLSLVGAVAGCIVTAYQIGLVKTLADPPLPIFDLEKVDASTSADTRLQTPDGAMMILTYAVTTILAAAGGKRRATTLRWLPIALAGETVLDVATNLMLAREEWAENKALCACCQTASLASITSAALAMPEAIKAVRG